MIKLIIFDLDGVLLDAKKIHYEAFNLALSQINKNLIISWSEHISIYDGLKTFQKLELLTKYKNLDPSLYDRIWKIKQEYTELMLDDIQYNENIYNCLSYLKENDYLIACCSNSITNTIIFTINNMSIKFFSIIFFKIYRIF